MFVRENQLACKFAIYRPLAAYYGVFKVLEMKISVENYGSDVVIRLRGENTPWVRANACVFANEPDELQYFIDRIELDNKVNCLTYQTII